VSWAIITRRWAPEIILALAGEPRRFNWLLGHITGISDRVLTERLRDLEVTGLVVRRVAVISPIRVTYALTAEGERYVQPLAQLHAIANRPQEVVAARAS